MMNELRAHGKRQADLVQRLLQVRPDAVGESHIAELCELLIAQGDAGTAKPIVDAFLKHSPDNVTALFYRGLLSEPDPRSCPPARRTELQEQAARSDCRSCPPGPESRALLRADAANGQGGSAVAKRSGCHGRATRGGRMMSPPSRPAHDRWRWGICSIWPVARRTGRWPRRQSNSPNATTWTIARAICSRRVWPLPGRSTTPR